MALSISLLIPCYNEEKTVRQCLRSCLKQTRKPDQIIAINDGSTDRTLEILRSFGKEITVINLPENTGNKSYAQEAGLAHVQSDIVLMTDADTLLSPTFVEEMEKSFKDPKVQAVAGYIISLRYNWLTACRELDYAVGQDIYKSGQWRIGGLAVIPGSAAAFRTKTFKKHITFDHDTLTEDLDFTYKLHENDLRIEFNKKAIAYTQDPHDLKSYVHQVRRWFGGGWQNFMKHRKIIFTKPALLIEVGLLYLESLLSPLVLVFLGIFYPRSFFVALTLYILVPILMGLYASIRMRNLSLLLYSPLFGFIILLNLLIFLEQFVKEVLFQKQSLVWYKPKRKTLR